jgi:virulence-associated protein VapD
MNTKKAEAVLRANEEAYTTAIQNQNEALTNMINAQELYRQKRDEVNKLESQAQHLASMSVEEYAAQNDLLWDMGTAANQLANDQEEMAQKILIAKSAMGEANVACHNAETAYTNYETAIQNYEGLSSAIISGDQKKISEALSNQMYDFQTAETGTRETLENQVEAYKDNYEKMEKAVENHAPGVTQAMVAEAKEMLKKSKAELAKLPPETEKSAKNAGNAAAKGMESTKSANKKAGEDIKKSAQTGAKDNGEMKKSGQAQGKEYSTGVDSEKGNSKTAGKHLAQEAKKGADTKDASTDSEKSGSHFGEGFFNGIGKWFSKVFSRGKGLSQEATRGLKEGQKEGSPSKITYQSGVYFVQGYINGIVSQQSKLKGTVKDMVSGVISILQNVDGYNFDEVGDTASNAYSEALKKKFDYAFNKMSYQNEQKLKEFDDVIDAYTVQQEEAADKIQASGDTLVSQLEASRELAVKEIEANRDAQIKALETQRDNTIKELELNRDNTVKKLNNQISELEKKISKTSDKDKKKKLQNEKKALQDEITATKNNASAQITAIKNSTKSKVDAIKKAATESINAQKEAYNKEIENQKALTKAQIEDSNENYNKLIENENANKEAYQTASSEMLSQYQSAMNEYQTQAQALIDDTINGITNRYNDNYDDLINKQNTLIKKLQGAGDLFNVSGAGIMTINDLTEQTRAIKEYTSRLQKIKNKVSTELFNEIASFDMKEGNAYMDRLLAMSSKDLEAYNKAYAEKLEAAQLAGDQIYKKDIEQLTKDYKNELKKGFEDLPKNLEELGNQAMQGFINGLTESTDYMSDEIKTYISAMVDTFKKELQINSPSKVMMEIGNYTGIGLVDGLKNTISEVKKTATSMAQTMATPLDSMKTSFGDIKSAVSGPNGSGAVNNSVVNNYNLVQNNNSPKSLSALETYQARRQQVAMIKALT